MKKIFSLFLCFTAVLSAGDRALQNIQSQAHIAVNIRRGHITIYTENKTVRHSFTDPNYRKAVMSGTLDQLLQLPELKSDRKGHCPLPIEVTAFPELPFCEKTGLAHSFLSWAVYLGEPWSYHVRSLGDIGLFIATVKNGNLNTGNGEPLQTKYHDRDGLLRFKDNKSRFTLPSEEALELWLKKYIGCSVAADIDYHECKTLEGIEKHFEFQPEQTRRKSLKRADASILAKLLLLGYPIIAKGKKETMNITAVHKEHIYAHARGRRYIGDIKGLTGEKLENSLTILKPARINGVVRTHLIKHLGLKSIAPKEEMTTEQEAEAKVVKKSPASPELPRNIRPLSIVTSWKSITAKPNQFINKEILFTLTPDKISSNKSGLWLISNQHALNTNNLSERLKSILKTSQNANLVFSGRLKQINKQKRYLDFENLRCRSY